MKCSKCENEIPEGAKFCPSCGKEVLGEEFSLKKMFSPTIILPQVGSLFGSYAESEKRNLLEIDEENGIINIPVYDIKWFKDPEKTDHLYYVRDIINFELLCDGTSLANGVSLTGAAIGGAVFGGAGAIVGAASKRKKCKSLLIKITFNNLNDPVDYIKVIDSNSAIKVDSDPYRKIYIMAQKCLSILAVLKKNAENKAPMAGNADCIVEEIKKYKELLDIGAITEDEFSEKKHQLLNL